MILDSKRNASPQLARVKTGILTTAAALLAIWGLRAGPRVALAAEGAENKPAKIEATGETKNVTEVHSDSIVAPSAGLPAAHSDSSTISTFSGPRAKPGPHPTTAAIAANPASEPVPPSNSFALAAPGGPEAPGQPGVPAAVPHRPRAVVRLESGYKGHDEDSLERRLDRLERMVETLMAREKVKPKMKGQEDFAYNYKAPNFSFAPDGKGSVKWESGISSDEDLARLKDLAKRQAELASRNAQRAAREMEKTTREIARSAEDAKLKAELGGQDNSDNSRQDSFEVQRRQLEATRKVLEKQMHALEKQISRLDEEREKANEQRDGDHDKRMNRLNRNLDNLKRDSVPAEEAPGKKQKSDSEVPN